MTSYFELYRPASRGPFPLICITPILGRLLFFPDLLLERHFARFFAARGLAAALIDRPIFEFDPRRGLEQIQTYLEESLSRNQKVFEGLLSQKEIDAKRVGTFGISFGAVINSLWASREPRLKAHVFALGGGNLPEIIVSSRDPLMRSYLQAIQKARGEEDLEGSLKKIFRLEPLESAPFIPREDVFLLLALFDRVIRLPYGLALWQALGKPETLFLPLGHYTSLLAVPFLKWAVLRFFQKRLSFRS